MIHHTPSLAWRTRHLRADCGSSAPPLRHRAGSLNREIRDAISSRHGLELRQPRITEALDATSWKRWESVVCLSREDCSAGVVCAAEPVQPEQESRMLVLMRKPGESCPA